MHPQPAANPPACHRLPVHGATGHHDDSEAKTIIEDPFKNIFAPVVFSTSLATVSQCHKLAGRERERSRQLTHRSSLEPYLTYLTYLPTSVSAHGEE